MVNIAHGGNPSYFIACEVSSEGSPVFGNEIQPRINEHFENCHDDFIDGLSDPAIMFVDSPCLVMLEDVNNWARGVVKAIDKLYEVGVMF